MIEENPKLFISYSWSNPEHEKWVINLASELVENGVDVIFDKWDLKEGQDANVFMERMVTDPEIKKVIIVCDQIYAQKADRRRGGVGTETQIISPAIYSKADQNKFVAVLSEKDENGNPHLPTYYKSRKYIDLSDNDRYGSNFEQLIRWIYDKPLYIKPGLGTKPSFLSDETPISLETTTKYRRARDAIRSNKDYAQGALADFFSTFATNMEKFRIAEKEGEFDEQVLGNIEKFLPYRTEAVEIFLTIARYLDTPETIKQLHRFLESIIPYMDKPQGITTWKDWDFDNFRFIVHELFLYAVTCLIKYECFNSVSQLLREQYYVKGNSDYGRNSMVPFTIFGQHMSSLEYRNKRLKLNRTSVRADLLVKRSETSGITQRQLLQSDLVLFIRDAFDAMRNKQGQKWWPVTLIYAERSRGPFEIFARAQSLEYFNKLKNVFGIEGKRDFELLFEAINKGELYGLSRISWPFGPDLSNLISIETMATLP
jgi:hypothetical protein